MDNEQQLVDLTQRCKERLLDFSVFREPDIGDQITAVAIEPSKTTQKLVSKIPLM